MRKKNKQKNPAVNDSNFSASVDNDVTTTYL